MKYLITKCISNNPKLYLRKRLFHRGYELLERCKYDIKYKHVVYFNTLSQAMNYIRHEYNLDIQL